MSDPSTILPTPLAATVIASPNSPAAQGYPDRIGPYRIITEVGRGGMGSVLRAVRDDDQLKKHVALKLIKKGLDTEALLTRFKIEKQILGSLNHPNIARILDAGATDDGRPYFVMEYIEGQPITDYCDTQQLSTEERLELFRKVCSAVHAAHQNLIVHRDIKPSNIIVTASGEPKLLDFGIAKLLNADLMGAAMATLPEERLLTPEYASPEQVQGLPITTASDVYSLGVLLYEMLTGRQPYQLKSRMHDELVRVVCEVEPERPSTAVTRPAEIVTREGTTRTLTADEIARRHAVPPSRLKRTLSGDLDNIVLMAMRKSPRRRYASAHELADDLVNHLEGRPVKARAETWAYVLTKFIRRNRVPVAAAAAVLMAVTAGGAAAAWWAGQAKEQGRQRIAAEIEAAKRLEQLREFAATFLTRLNSSILRLEGSTTAQLLLTQTSVDVLDRLAAEPAGSSDPQLQSSLARGYQVLGGVRGGYRGGNQQDSAAASECYRKAVDAWAKVGPPEQLAPADLIAWCNLKLDMAVLENLRGKGEAARAKQESALSHIDAVLAQVPRLRTRDVDYSALRIEPWALLTRSDILEAMGRTDQSGASLDESIELRRDLVARFESNHDAKRDLAVAVLRKAFKEQIQGNIDASFTLASEALRLRESIAAQNGSNSSFQRDLALTRSFLADLWVDKGDLARALALEEDAAAIYRTLAARDPDNARAARDEWYVLGEVAYLRLALGNERADATVTEYLASATRWIAIGKSGADRTNLAGQMYDIGTVASRVGRTDAARACLRQSLQLCREYGLQLEGVDAGTIEAALKQLGPGSGP